MALSVIYPELALLGLAVVLLLLDLAWPRLRAGLGYLAALGCAAIMAALLAAPPAGVAFGGAFVADGTTVLFKLIFLAAAVLVSLVSVRYLGTITRSHGEYYLLLCLSALGLMVMSSAGDLLLLYLGLELSTISLYPLAAFHKDNPRSAEAGLKFMLLGAVSSAVLLYGLSLLYGVTGTTSFRLISDALAAGRLTGGLALALAFVAAGFAFKVAAAPFHMWAPDVYEGAPTPVTAFVSVASKSAGFAVLLRLFAGPLLSASGLWAGLFALLSLASMVVGNLVAIPQTNVKRMLAYSGIAQAGYVLVGLAAASALGAGFSIFFLAQYTLVNIGAFIVVLLVAQGTGSEQLGAFAGLGRRSPLLALSMLLLLLSLGGIPPLAGFWAKLYVFLAGVQAGLWWLVLVGVLASVLSLYYYLMVVRQMYMVAPPSPDPLPIPRPAALALLICTGLTVALAYPGPLVAAALAAGRALLP